MGLAPSSSSSSIFPKLLAQPSSVCLLFLPSLFSWFPHLLSAILLPTLPSWLLCVEPFLLRFSKSRLSSVSSLLTSQFAINPWPKLFGWYLVHLSLRALLPGKLPDQTPPPTLPLPCSPLIEMLMRLLPSLPVAGRRAVSGARHCTCQVRGWRGSAARFNWKGTSHNPATPGSREQEAAPASCSPRSRRQRRR